MVRWNGEVSMKKLGIPSNILDYIWKTLNASPTNMLDLTRSHVNYYEGTIFWLRQLILLIILIS
jgi:hypothetical protein